MTERILSIPTLETDRLRLRGIEESDFEAYARMLSEPEVARHLGDGRPVSTVEAWRQIAVILGHWVIRGFGLWAVEERESGVLVGRIGLWEPTGWPGFEVAYTLDRAYWGRGYAREGARAALEYARRELGRRAIISIIRPANLASIRVATALGATYAETIEFFGAPSDVYRYPELGEGAS